MLGEILLNEHLKQLWRTRMLKYETGQKIPAKCKTIFLRKSQGVPFATTYFGSLILRLCTLIRSRFYSNI